MATTISGIPMTTEQIIEKLNQQKFSSNPFFRLMDFTVVKVSKAKAVMTIACNKDTVSFQGSLYGGVISFSADVAIWVALLGHGVEHGVVTTDLNIHYLDRFEKGKALLEARVLRLGKRMIMGEVNMFNHKKVLAAHATGSFLKV